MILSIWKYFTTEITSSPVITTGNMLVARLSSLPEKSHVTPVDHVSPTIAPLSVVLNTKTIDIRDIAPEKTIEEERTVNNLS